MMKTLAAAVAATLIAAAQAVATDYYVRNGGSDAADGLSLPGAWATLSHAADVAAAGDTVHVADGSYAGFYLDHGGSAGNPITFQAEGSSVQITADNGITPDGINVEGADYVVIDGFIVNNRTRAGIRVALAHFVTVRNCHTGGNGRWGVFTGFADDLTIENNETYGSIAEHGIYVSNSGDRPVIRGNLVYDNHANGIHMNGDASQGGDGTISDALVENNIIYGNGSGGGSGINMDGVVDSVLRNNLLYDNHASGISLYRIDGATGATGNLVINNTIVNASDARWSVNINTGSSGNRLLNNIIYNYHPSRGAISVDASSRPGFVSDYNSLMDRMSPNGDTTVLTLAQWQALGYDTHSFVATPAENFLAPGSDFHLLNSSPAVDAGGAADAPSRDLEGNPRPVGAAVDAGAYEAQLPDCGNGSADPGEQCGDPGTAGCADPCTGCLQCVCAQEAPVCGDALLCGSEQCEANADCASGEFCQACACVNEPACDSGIAAERARLKLRAVDSRLLLKGEAVIAKPWSAVDPAVNGLRVVIDARSGSGGLDVTVPGGEPWKASPAGSKWSYSDKSGAVSGITRVVVSDRSKKQDGLLRWTVKGKGGAVTLPDVSRLRSAVILGAPFECAATEWNPPGGSSPACKGDDSKLSCR